MISGKFQQQQHSFDIVYITFNYILWISHMSKYAIFKIHGINIYVKQYAIVLKDFHN